MTVRKLFALACLTLASTASNTFAGDAGLIRIEPRLFYGASVTMENGVRVWRTLPPTRQMIINPTNAPVNVNVTDVRERVTHHNHNYVHGAPTGAGYAHGGSYYSTPGYYYGRGYAGRHFQNRAAGLRAHGRRKH